MMLMLIISALIDLGFLMNTRLVLVAAARKVRVGRQLTVEPAMLFDN